MRAELDPQLTLERFVVGSGNRMAAAAARRAAEAPGRSYNPLVICGPSGLGKTHLLTAIGHLARQVEPDLQVHYETAASFVDRLSAGLAAGDLDLFREENLRIGFMLLDDLQQIAGKSRTQEELQALWEDMLRWEVQVVIASDRPPHEIDGLDEQLRSRLAAGLTVEIAAPDEETRLGILQRWRSELGAPLSGELLERLAALALGDVRALRVALEQVMEWREREEREPDAEELAALVGAEPVPAASDEFGAFLTDVSTALAAVVETAPWKRRIAEAILRWEGEGVRTRRLEEVLEADSAPDVEAVLGAFAADVARLRQVERELGGRAPDRAVFADPDRLSEAEALLLARKAPAADEPPLPDAGPAEQAGSAVDRWFLNREKLAWEWVALDDRLMEERG